jgi:hypothetical protein
MDKERAEKLYEIYQELIVEKEKTHYDFLKTKHWKEDVRPKILQYDGYHCLICREEVSPKDAHIHHIIDFSGDEDLSPKNLVTLCTKCHAKLHPVFPDGMWALGWPQLDKVKNELRSFYKKVRKASIENRSRFKAPLEHLMMHICLICPHLQECDMGGFTLNDVSKTMESFARLQQKRCRIGDLKDGMKHLTIIGKIINMSEPKEVETRYGKTLLVVAQLKDESGEVLLNLYSEQIKKVKTGDIVILENGYTLLYGGKLTLNIPKEGGRIIKYKSASGLNFKEDDVKSYPYHKIAVNNLEGSSYKGRFSEILILRVCKNQHYSCPKNCSYTWPHTLAECRYKKLLMSEPIEDELICTSVLVEIRSSLRHDLGTLVVRETNRLVDSKGRSYRSLAPYFCDNIYSQAKQEYGYFSRGQNEILIFEETKERILLPFPEIPKRENIEGIIIQLWSIKSGIEKSIETFDFRLRKPVPKKNHNLFSNLNYKFR